MRHIPFAYMRQQRGPTPPLPIDTGSNMIFYYDFTNVNSYPTTGSVAYNLITNSLYSGRTLNLNSGNFPLTTGYTSNNFGEMSYNGVNQRGETSGNLSGDTLNWSLGGWFKATTDSGVLFARDGFFSSPGYSMSITKEVDDTLNLRIINSRNRVNQSGVYGLNVPGHTVLIPDTWYYVMGIWQSGNNGRLYLNGNLEGMSKSTNTLLFGSNQLNQSSLRTNTGLQQYYSGSFGDYEVYASDISGSVVLNNFNAKKGTYEVEYEPNTDIPINTQMTVTNGNTGSLRVFVDEGSGYNLQYTLTNTNTTTLSTENTLYGSSVVINSGSSFYVTSDDRRINASDLAYLKVFKNLQQVENISGSLAVTSSIFTANNGDAFTLQASAGTPGF